MLDIVSAQAYSAWLGKNLYCTSSLNGHSLAQPGLEVEMNIIVAIIGVVLPTLIVGLFAYFAYLTEGAERERR